MSETAKHTINLDRIVDIAHVGVRRAAIFMGLGLNAAARADFNDYELHKLPMVPGQTAPPIDLIPSGLPLERVAEFKGEFATWITGCGMRELMEHYALMLDHINKAALLVWQTKGKLGDIDPVKATERFTLRLGTTDKLEMLRKRFGIAINEEPSVVQLHDGRNCLTHDIGIVKPTRCGEDGHMLLTWRAMDLLVSEDGGETRTLVSTYGHRIEKESTVLLRWSTRERRFAAGTKMVLSQQDLWEICMFFSAVVIPRTTSAFIGFLRDHNVDGVPPLAEATPPA